MDDGPRNMIETEKEASELLNAFAQAIKRTQQPSIQSAEPKYDMTVQKEILKLQVSCGQSIVRWFILDIQIVACDWLIVIFRENQHSTRSRVAISSPVMVKD